MADSLYYVKYGSSIITSKIPSKILSNKNIKTGVSVVFKTKRELKCPNKLFFWNHQFFFFFVFITENF